MTAKTRLEVYIVRHEGERRRFDVGLAGESILTKKAGGWSAIKERPFKEEEDLKTFSDTLASEMTTVIKSLLGQSDVDDVKVNSRSGLCIQFGHYAATKTGASRRRQIIREAFEAGYGEKYTIHPTQGSYEDSKN